MPKLVGRHYVIWQCTAKLCVCLDRPKSSLVPFLIWALMKGHEGSPALIRYCFKIGQIVSSPNSTGTIAATNWPSLSVSWGCLHNCTSWAYVSFETSPIRTKPATLKNSKYAFILKKNIKYVSISVANSM